MKWEHDQCSALKRIVISSRVSGICAICSKSSKDLRDLYANNTVEADAENICQMLAFCFHIKIVSESESIEICGGCVSQLRAAAAFRKQVEAIGNILEQMINIKTDKDENKLITTQESVTLSQTFNIAEKKSIEQASDKTNSNDQCRFKQQNDDFVTDDFSGDKSVEYKETMFDCKSKSRFDKSKRTKSKLIEWYNQKELSKESAVHAKPKIDLACKTCPVCSAECKSRHALLQHYTYNHTSRFLCEICGKSFVSDSKYKMHLDYHNGARYPCPQCEKTYSSKDGVNNHVRIFHEDNKSCKCRQCGKQLAGPVKRKEHMREVHGVRYKEYACPQCHKKCATKYRLDKHVRGVHADERNFACTLCDSRFLTKNRLNTHLNTVHSDKKNFQCDICGKAVNCRATLQRHLCIHYNIRKYKCALCGQAFIQNTSLRGHMKSHHKNESESPRKKNVA